MNNISFNTTAQTPFPYPIFSKATLAKKLTKAEKAKLLKPKAIYTTEEACIYIGYSKAVLRRMVDLRLIRPTNRRIWGRHLYWTVQLDAAKEKYEALKKEKMLNKLPLCKCL